MKSLVKQAMRYFGVLLLTGCTSTITMANEVNDSQKPINITSNTFSYDNIKGIAIYSGNVLAVQGSRQLKADELQLYRDNRGDPDKIIAIGKPAHYQNKTSAGKPLLRAQANNIEYDLNKQMLYLIGAAQVEQGGDRYQAPRIEYNQLTDTVKSPPSEQGRTTITIQPRTHNASSPTLIPDNK